MNIDNKRKQTSYLKYLFTVFFWALYPFFPFIKEWNMSLGTILETVLFLFLSLSYFFKIEYGKILINIPLRELLYIFLVVLYFFIGFSDIESSFSGLRSFLLYLFLFSFLLNNRDYLIPAIFSSSLVAIIMSIGAIIQFFNPIFIKQLHPQTAYGSLKSNFVENSIFNRAISFFTDPNILGMYLCFQFFLMVFLFVRFRKKYRFLFFLVAVLNLIAIMFTYSRSCLTVLIIFFLITFLSFGLNRKKVKASKVLWIATLIIIAVIIIYHYWDNIAPYLRLNTISTGNGRFTKIGSNFDALITSDKIHDVLIGRGLNSGRGRIIKFENSLFLLIYNFGFLGIVPFGVICYICFKKGINKSTIAVIISYLVANLVGDFIMIPQVTNLFILNIVIRSLYRNENTLSS